MKAVPKIGLDGLYIEDIIMDDAFSGVAPFYVREPDSGAETLEDVDTAAEDERPAEEPEPAGYIVGVPVPPGLYLPKFDLAAWNEDSSLDPTAYWSEALTPNEIGDLIKPKPQEPTPTDLLGAELTAIKLQNIEQQAVVSSLGSELTAARLHSIQQQQTISALGAELTAAKLEIIKLKGDE
ncbi:hypothetical protein NYE69_27015 [Paenibacillus sp. FSL R5-0527]|uniref:hypothetical protein n=1 Tax=Paenibacillus sp. FSL R5-0527 TaxID=2975321 RepID=UPI00097AB901|nr:hypothetical protein BK140_22470 [Paenibacillus macerans]